MICVTIKHRIDSKRLYNKFTHEKHEDQWRDIRVIDLGEKVYLMVDGDLSLAIVILAACWEFSPFELAITTPPGGEHHEEKEDGF